MTVATIGLDGFPKSRVVLLKKFTEEGFIFTPIIIRKAIEANLKYVFLFWHSMERQVIIKGCPKNLRNHF
jgi:pyridoxamine 5'-phosphate oxidase